METTVSAIIAVSIAIVISVIALAAGLNYLFPMISGLTSIDYPAGPNTSAAVVENGGKTYVLISNLKDSPVSVVVLAGCTNGYYEKTVSIRGGDMATLVFHGSCGITIRDGGVEYKP